MRNFNLDVKASDECCLSIQKYVPLTANVFKVICSHANRHYTNEQYRDAVANMSDNKFRLVAGTITRHEDGIFASNPHVEMLIEANTLTKSFTQANVKGFKTIASNVFMSEDDKIWKKVGEGENAKLVLKSNDDLESILKERRARKMTTQASMIEIPVVEKGAYVRFFNPKAGCLQFGIKTEAGVFERSTSTEYKVEANQIVDIANHTELMNVMAEVEQKGLTQVLNYMGKLFKDKPEFFNSLEALIKQRRADGDEGDFEDTMNTDNVD